MTQRDKANEVPIALKPYSKRDDNPALACDVARAGEVLTYRLASLERARSAAKPKLGPESQGSGKTLALNFSWQMAPS